MKNSKGYNYTIELAIPSFSHRNIESSGLLSCYKDNSLIITSIEQIKILFKSKAIAGDGTFNIRPKFNNKSPKQHEQVFKLFGVHTYTMTNNQTLTVSYLCVMCILDNKTTEIYEWVYNTIYEWGKYYCDLENHNIEVYLCDYEKQQRQAWLNTIGKYMNIRLGGDEFHYAKSIIKYTRMTCSLKKYYDICHKNNKEDFDSTFRKIIGQLLALSHIQCYYIKEFDIRICKKLINHFFKKYPNQKELQRNVMHFIKYYLSTWCEKNYDDIMLHFEEDIKKCEYKFTKKNMSPTKYKMEEWNLYDYRIRTNNSVEVYNLHHRQIIGYYPTMTRLHLWFLREQSNMVRNYIYNTKKVVLPISYLNSGIKKKNELLYKYKSTIWTYKEFKAFADKLSDIRFRNNHKKYSLDDDDEDDNDNDEQYIDDEKDHVSGDDDNEDDNAEHIFDKIQKLFDQRDNNQQKKHHKIPIKISSQKLNEAKKAGVILNDEDYCSTDNDEPITNELDEIIQCEDTKQKTKKKLTLSSKQSKYRNIKDKTAQDKKKKKITKKKKKKNKSKSKKIKKKNKKKNNNKTLHQFKQYKCYNNTFNLQTNIIKIRQFIQDNDIKMEQIIDELEDCNDDFNIKNLTIKQYIYLFNNGVCGICNNKKLFSSTIHWHRCNKCRRWDHEICIKAMEQVHEINLIDGQSNDYVCIYC